MSPAPTESDWRAGVASSLGASVRAERVVAGGDIAASRRVTLDDGRVLFVKAYASSRGPREAEADTDRGARETGMGAAEAHGLLWLSEPGALCVARPLAWGETWLALEWIESAPRVGDYDRRLGTGLARLHAASLPTFGHEREGWLATLPQSNRPHARWADFYAEERVLPLTARAFDRGLVPRDLRDRLERLVARMDTLVGPAEPPSRLHGDLWGGNVIADARGEPCLIDPAIYAGHREVDLAMMRLFGGFSAAVFEAYEAVHPLAPDWRHRVPLYQIWPLLAHVCLFGASWVGQLADAVEAALSGD